MRRQSVRTRVGESRGGSGRSRREDRVRKLLLHLPQSGPVVLCSVTSHCRLPSRAEHTLACTGCTGTWGTGWGSGEPGGGSGSRGWESVGVADLPRLSPLWDKCPRGTILSPSRKRRPWLLPLTGLSQMLYF